MTTTPKKMPARRRRRERGVALIIAVISITVLTVVATEFAYNQRVDLQIAANHRDDIRAYYLARSGVGLSRMLLRFQKQLDTMMGAMSKGIGDISGAAGGAGAGQLPVPTNINIQLWRMAKIDCHLLAGLVNQEGTGDPRDERPSGGGDKFDFDDEFPELAAEQGQRNFGGFEGCFQATITDEEERINVNSLNLPGQQSLPTAQALYTMMSAKQFEFLFDRMDANRVQVKPEDVIIAMKDWVDEDETQSSIQVGQNGILTAMVDGFSDEGSHYDRYEPRYEPKNFRLDTLDELYRVHGVNDAFMAAFRDRLTVFPDANSKININTDDPVMMHANILMAADPRAPDPRLTDPVFIDEVIQRIRAVRMISGLGMGVQDFLAVLTTMGIAINPSISANVAGNAYFSDKSNTYRIVSVGEAGSVQKTITTVVRLDDGLGRLVYWREE